MIKIEYKRNKCIGCAYCSDIDSFRWRINQADGKCDLFDSVEQKGIFILNTTDDEFENFKSASESCPVKIIKVQKI